MRLLGLRRARVYRQTWMGNLTLALAAIARKL
jgi:hypothetical protein